MTQAKLLVEKFKVFEHTRNFDQDVTKLHDLIHDHDKENFTIQKDALVGRHFKPSMTQDEVKSLSEAAIDLGFRHAQHRKAQAGMVYQEIIRSELRDHGLYVFSPPRKTFGTIDLMCVDENNGRPIAFLPVKRTIRERGRMEKVYASLMQRFNAPCLFVTHEPNPYTNQIEEIVEFGFHVFLRDHLVEQFDSPKVVPMSQLPSFLRGLEHRQAIAA